MVFFAVNGCCKWSLQVVFLEVSYFCCKLPAVSDLLYVLELQKRFCWKLPKFRGTAETESLQMDLLQVLIDLSDILKQFFAYYRKFQESFSQTLAILSMLINFKIPGCAFWSLKKPFEHNERPERWSFILNYLKKLPYLSSYWNKNRI